MRKRLPVNLRLMPLAIAISVISGFLIAKFGPILLAIPLLLFAWPFIINRWQRGIYLLILFMPFAGIPILLAYPSGLAALTKDFLFVVPIYLGFLLSWIINREQQKQIRIPAIVGVAVLCLAIVTLYQALNPKAANWLVSFIGLKVWLFYIPLMFLGSAYIRKKTDLIKLLRLMAVIAWIPCTIGILQWLSCMTFGYQETMQAIYGETALSATQNYALFVIGGYFYRIPSTFSFVTQYFGYILAMIVPAYALSRLDDSSRWRKFAKITLIYMILASFLCGAKAAYVFVPLLLMFTFLLDGRLVGVLRGAVVLPLIFFLSMSIGGIDTAKLVNMVYSQVGHYGQEQAYGGLAMALEKAPFGVGTGMNTGAGRYAFADPASFITIENYYAKAVVELGLIGLFIVVALFLSLIVLGFRKRKYLSDPGLRSCSAVFVAFIITMALNSFKGWQLDLDPINVYFWLFAGFMFKLGYIDQEANDPEPVFKHAEAGRMSLFASPARKSV